MTDASCSERRRALLEDERGLDWAQHVQECPKCAAFAERLEAVDGLLEAESRAAEASGLPPQLRARILAAARPAPVRPRGRLIDGLFRLAAVAAVLVAVALALPAELLVQELDLSMVGQLGSQLSVILAAESPVSLPQLSGPTNLPSPGNTIPVLGVAMALVATGLLLLRREARP